MNVIHSAISRGHDNIKENSAHIFRYLQFVNRSDQEAVIVVAHVPLAVKELGLKSSEQGVLLPIPLLAQLNQGVLLALDDDEVALGGRQPTNPRLSFSKIAHHLIKCATTTNAETIHHLLLKSKEPVSNLVDGDELRSPPELNNVVGQWHQLPLEGRSQGSLSKLAKPNILSL